MFKQIIRTSAAVVGALAITSIGLPAHAFTPTMSEVRYLSGPAADDSMDGLALTANAETAVLLSGGDAWIVDVEPNTSTLVTGLDNAQAVILDHSDTFAYIAESTGSWPNNSYQVSKVNLASATVVSTWPDADFTFAPGYMFLSDDGSRLYMVGKTGSNPNFSVAVATLNTATGAITQQVWGDGDPGFSPNQPAYDTNSGKIMIPYSDTATGLVTGFAVFNTANETFADIPWAGAGSLIACDSKSSVVACIVDDTDPYVATINSSGAVLTSFDLDTSVSDAQYVMLTPDAAQVYVYGENGATSVGNVEVISLSPMASVTIFETAMDYPNVVVMAPDAGQIWFTADYIEDYDGGYRVVQFADPNAGSGGSGEELAPTGGNSVLAGTLVALSAVALVAGVLTRRGTRRHRA
jgi:hypothetical protein